MYNLSEAIKPVAALDPQAINSGSTVYGNPFSAAGSSDLDVILALGGLTPSNTTAISSLVQMQVSEDGGSTWNNLLDADGNLVNMTNVIANQRTTITLSTNLISGNIFALTINGVAIAPVTFDTTHAQTITDILAAINTSPWSAYLTATASGDVITLTANRAGIGFTVNSAAVSGGVSQPTIAIASPVPASGSNVAELRVKLQELITEGFASVPPAQVFALYRVAVTHTITGGGSALQTAVIAALGGQDNLPSV